MGIYKFADYAANRFKSTKVFMATPQGRCLGYHTLAQVSNPEPLDSRCCVLTTTLLGEGGGLCS